MSQSDDKLEEEIRAQVRRVYHDEHELLTVNYIRKAAEEKLGLDEGFLQLGAWKARSKSLIKETVESIENGPEGPTTPKEQTAASAKRKSPEASPEPAAKRRKQTNAKGAKNGKAAPESEDDDEEEVDDTPKVTKKTAGNRRRKSAIDTEDDDEEEPKPVKAKAKPKPKPKAKVKAQPKPRGRGAAKKKKQQSESEEESELSDAQDTEDEESLLSSPPAKSVSADESSGLSSLEDEPPKSTKRGKQAKPAPKPKAAAKNTKSKEAVDSEVDNEDAKDKANESDSSALSSLIDEAPPPKRGKQKKGAAAAAPRAKKAAPADDPDVAEVKKLQAQLVKCGIRKAWGIELKEHGSDAKAKIRHLRGMLRDVGMDGRFSEQKAREIKERRELMADLEAVNEMNDMWGADGGRPKRGRGKGKKPIVDDSDSNEDEDDGAAGGEAKAAKNGGGAADDGSGSDEEADVVASHARGRSRAMADLAFLGDDDEESD